MRIEKLTWDTEFFGLRIGRVVIYDENKFNPIEFKNQADNAGYELVYIFKYNDFLNKQNVFRANLELVDIMLTMSQRLEKDKYTEIDYEFHNTLKEQELAECYKIAKKISIKSRFYKEKLIGPYKTNELYTKWVDNALTNSFCDGMFLAKLDQKIVGFHIINTDESNHTGYCSIIGVDSDYEGKKIGKYLWDQAFKYWSNKKIIEKCVVPFSLLNKDSFNFHMKMGFNKTEEIKYIYHYRNVK